MPAGSVKVRVAAKDIRPAPFPICVRILSQQGGRNAGATNVTPPIPLKPLEGLAQLGFQRRGAQFSEWGATILVALRRANDDLPPLEIHVFYPQRHALQHPESASIHDRGTEPRGVSELAQKRLHLARRKHDGDAAGTSGGLDPVNVRQRRAQHVLVQEQQSGQRLVLRCRSHAVRRCERREECAHVLDTKLPGVPPSMMHDVPADPVRIRFLGSRAISPLAHATTHDFHEPESTLRVRRGSQVGLRNQWERHASVFALALRDASPFSCNPNRDGSTWTVAR